MPHTIKNSAVTVAKKVAEGNLFDLFKDIAKTFPSRLSINKIVVVNT